MEFWDWLQQNASLMSALGGWLLVIIWAAYLHMFYRQSRRFHKPQLLIHCAPGSELNASCLLVNMAKEVVHIECVILMVETKQGKQVHQVTGYERRIPSDEAGTRERLRQGPLNSGDSLLLGRLEEMLPRYNPPEHPRSEYQELPPSLRDVEAFELRAVAVHGPGERLVGARRRFLVEQHDRQPRFLPEKLLTEQLRSRRDQPRLRRWLRDSLTQVGDGHWPEPSQDASALAK